MFTIILGWETLAICILNFSQIDFNYGKKYVEIFKSPPFWKKMALMNELGVNCLFYVRTAYGPNLFKNVDFICIQNFSMVTILKQNSAGNLYYYVLRG